MREVVVFNKDTGELGIRRTIQDKDWPSNYAVFILDPITLEETGEKQHANSPWRDLPPDDPRVTFVELFDIFEGGHADWYVNHCEACEPDEMYIENRAEVWELFKNNILDKKQKKLVTAVKQLQVDGESILDLEAKVKRLEAKIKDMTEPSSTLMLLNLDYLDGLAEKLPAGLGEETLRWAVYAVKQYVKYNKIPGGPIDPNAWNWEKFKASFIPAEKKDEDGSPP